MPFRTISLARHIAQQKKRNAEELRYGSGDDPGDTPETTDDDFDDANERELAEAERYLREKKR